MKGLGGQMSDAPERLPAIDRLLDLLCRICLIAAGIALVTIVVTFGWLVWGRYVMNQTPTWVEQLSLLLIIWVSFLVAAVGVREDNHLSVEMFRDALPARARFATLIAADLLMLAFGALMAWHAWSLVSFGWTTKIALIGLPEGLRSLAMVVCGTLIAVFMARRLVGRFSTRGSGQPAPHPPPSGEDD